MDIYMNTQSSITAALKSSVNQFNELVSSLDSNEFELNPNNKWSAGQDLVHLIKVLKIVNIGFTLPKILLKLLFGVHKQAPRTFEQLQTMYKNALAGGAKAPSIYIPKPVLYKDKNVLLEKHHALNAKFMEKINSRSDFELDNYCLPHPILGKVSLRELAIFTSFHSQHHYDLLKSKLKKA
jgi:hypothetical protein